MGKIACYQGTDVIEWTISDTVANVHNVGFIEVYWVRGRFRDEQAKNCLGFAQSILMSLR